MAISTGTASTAFFSSAALASPSPVLQPPSSRLVVINNAAAQVPLRPGKKESGDIVVS
ncbi:exported hypothetical protein [Xanthomonas hortorum pv. vitians]|nr:exported hypothetical protein [Xanthomonas hortorum pv. vitians]